MFDSSEPVFEEGLSTGGNHLKRLWRPLDLNPRTSSSVLKMNRILAGQSLLTSRIYLPMSFLRSYTSQVFIKNRDKGLPLLTFLPDFPFLQGRGFVFASQFAKLLPLQLAGQYLEAAMHVIESNSAGIPVKISAVKAIHK